MIENSDGANLKPVNLKPDRLETVKSGPENEAHSDEINVKLNLETKSSQNVQKDTKKDSKTADYTNDYTFKLNHARNLVQNAVKSKKIFCVQGGYPVVRFMLKKKGWLERDWKSTHAGSVYDPPLSPHSKNKSKKSEKEDDEEPLSDDDDTPDFKQLDKDLIGYEKSLNQLENNSIDALCGRMLKDESLDKCNFYWMIRTAGMNIREMTSRWQMINHFPGASYCTKSGIMDLLKNHLHWATDTLPAEFFPRCYKLSNPDQRYEFLTDYKISVGICILRIFLKQKFGDNDDTILNTPRSDYSDINSPKSSPRFDTPKFTPRIGTRKRQRNRELIPSQVLEKAIETIKTEINSITEDTHSNYENGVLEEESNKKQKSNEDGISLTTEPSSANSKKCEKEISEEDRTWYNNYYKLAYNEANFEPGTYSKFNSTEIKNLLESSNLYLKKYQPEILNSHNLWIVKPGAKSRGRGIQVQSKILEILRSYVGVGEPNLQKDGRWIIQKYIERPLLVHDTKFDIRQWFLIDNWSPLKIWLYKDSYLRFSSRKFSLTNHSQAIHLCNYSIQKNIENLEGSKGGFGMDTSKLPEDNMWTNKIFVKWYYERYGVEDIWSAEIWPQMLEITKKVMLTALESGNMEAAGRMKGSYELYGADFMITMNDKKPKVWLVEINSSPTMALNSSTATHKLCREVLEDTVNLVLSENRWNSQTGSKIGKFELGYVHNTGQKLPSYSGEKMECAAVQIRKPREPRKSRVFRLPGDHTALRKRDTSVGKGEESKLKLVKSDEIGESSRNVNSDDRENRENEDDDVIQEGYRNDKSEIKRAEIEAKTFSRKLTLRKVSAQKSPVSDDFEEKNHDLVSELAIDLPSDLIPNLTPRNKRKPLPKLERRPLAQREHKPKNSELPVNPDKKPYIRRLPKRTYRTPMAIAVCSSQTTLTPVGSKATENRVIYNNKSKGDINEIKNMKSGKQMNNLPFPVKIRNGKNNNYLTTGNGTIQYLSNSIADNRVISKICFTTSDSSTDNRPDSKADSNADSKTNNLTNKIIENNSNKITDEINERLNDRITNKLTGYDELNDKPNDKLTDKITNKIRINTDKITENLGCSADINYSVLVNGKVHPKRIKQPFTDKNFKYSSNLYNSETKLRAITSLNSLINPTKIAKQLSSTVSKQTSNKQFQNNKPFQNNKQFQNSKQFQSSKNFQDSQNANQQKTVSVVDMSSWLHRGSSYNRKTYHNFSVKNATSRSHNLWHPNQII